MKKVLSIVLTLVLLFTITHFHVMANDEITVYLDGHKIEFDQPPIIINDRTLVPMRALFEALGATVEWDEESQEAIGTVPGIEIEIKIGADYVSVNTVKLVLDCPSQKINDRVLVPLRVISESLGVDVQWDEKNNSVIMKNKNIIKTIESEGFIHKGMLQNGKLNGYGTIYYPNGKLHSQGYYIDNVLQEGFYVWGTGDFLFGKFKDWKLNGDDCCYVNESMLVIGKFVDNIPTGEVYIKYENGDKYLGETNGFERNGKGTYYYNSGAIYIGSWLNGETIGEGQYFFEDGESFLQGNFTSGSTINGYGAYYDYSNNCLYEGNFVNGEMNGEFTVYLYNQGILVHAYFRNNELITYEVIGEL